MILNKLIQSKFNKKITIRLKDMINFFSDKEAVYKRIKQNPLIYTVLVKKDKEMEFTLTILESGKVGKEYFMTRGHYHKISSPEVYILLSGEGILLLQNKKLKKNKLEKNKPYYINPDCAHRVINTGKKKMQFISIYSPRAGHDYKKIKKKRFK